jgi:ribosomal protein L30E
LKIPDPAKIKGGGEVKGIKRILKVVNNGNTKYVAIRKLIPSSWNGDLVEAEFVNNQIIISDYKGKRK